MSRSCSPRTAASTIRRDRALRVLTGAALVLACARLAAAAAEVLDDAWIKVLLGGDHVGWVHLIVEREGEVVTTGSEEYMKLGRYGSQVEVRVTRAFVETEAGRPISFEQEILMSAKPQKLVGRIEDGKLVLSTTVMGRTRSVELDWKEGAVLEWGAELKERAILKPGGKVTYDTFNAEVGRFVEVEAEYLGREKVELPSGIR